MVTNAIGSGDVSLCLYDVTTLYFEAEKEDPDVGGKTGLHKVGYSKERRVDPQHLQRAVEHVAGGGEHVAPPPDDPICRLPRRYQQHPDRQPFEGAITGPPIAR